MAGPRRIDSLLVQQAQEAAAAASSVESLRRSQAVLLPGLLGATLEQTAAALGVSRATVPRLQAAFRKEKKQRTSASEPPSTWGGRRRSLLTPEEREFLQPWLEQAKAGAVVVVSPLRAALAQRLKRPIRPSVICRLPFGPEPAEGLARQGWRKVAPDTRHPKSKPEVQEAWKKNSRKHWRAC